MVSKSLGITTEKDEHDQEHPGPWPPTKETGKTCRNNTQSTFWYSHPTWWFQPERPAKKYVKCLYSHYHYVTIVIWMIGDSRSKQQNNCCKQTQTSQQYTQETNTGTNFQQNRHLGRSTTLRGRTFLHLPRASSQCRTFLSSVFFRATFRVRRT